MGKVSSFHLAPVVDHLVSELWSSSKPFYGRDLLPSAGPRGAARQTPGPSGRKSGPVWLAYCWVHACRKIKEVHDRDGSPIAAEGLKRIAKFDKSEEAIRGQSAEQRNAARQEQTKPLKKDVVVRLEVQRSRISGQITSWQEAIRHCKIYGPLEAVSG